MAEYNAGASWLKDAIETIRKHGIEETRAETSFEKGNFRHFIITQNGKLTESKIRFCDEYVIRHETIESLIAITMSKPETVFYVSQTNGKIVAEHSPIFFSEFSLAASDELVILQLLKSARSYKVFAESLRPMEKMMPPAIYACLQGIRWNLKSGGEAKMELYGIENTKGFEEFSISFDSLVGKSQSTLPTEWPMNLPVIAGWDKKYDVVCQLTIKQPTEQNSVIGFFICVDAREATKKAIKDIGEHIALKTNCQVYQATKLVNI